MQAETPKVVSMEMTELRKAYTQAVLDVLIAAGLIPSASLQWYGQGVHTQLSEARCTVSLHWKGDKLRLQGELPVTCQNFVVTNTGKYYSYDYAYESLPKEAEDELWFDSETTDPKRVACLIIKALT